MLPLYVVSFTLQDKDSTRSEDQFEQYIQPALNHATNLMGLISSGDKPVVSICHQPILHAKIILSASIGKSRAQHLIHIASDLGDLMAYELPDCVVSVKADKLVFGQEK